MSAITRKRWTKNEDEILSSSLVNGIELQELHKLLPTRSQHAIIRRCLNLGFSTHAKNGVKVLYSGIKRRTRILKVEAKKKNDEVAADATITTGHSDAPATAERFEKKSTIIVAENNLVCDTCVATKISVLHANKLAIDILSTYHISMSPTTIAELSNQILNSIKDL